MHVFEVPGVLTLSVLLFLTRCLWPMAIAYGQGGVSGNIAGTTQRRIA